jgi:hypothetical protein
MSIYKSKPNSHDKKFVRLQTRKVISAYGGSGSIIETPYGALLIEDFNRWPFFKGEYKDNQQIINIQKAFHISDERLLQRLNNKNGFSKLEAFVHVPDNVSSSKRADIPENEDETISAQYFPKWFYCNKCKRFKIIEHWWKFWLDFHKGKIEKKSFVPPKCGLCAVKKDNRTYAPELEQVRFILTSPDGEMKDIQWHQWNLAIKETNDEDSESGSIQLPLDKNETCCNNQDLKYEKSSKFSDLAGISIECVNPDCPSKGKRVNLAGLFGLRIFRKYWKDQEGNRIKRLNKDGKMMDAKAYFKPVIRTSNSVYYPIMVSSIYLPIDRGITLEDQTSIDDWVTENEDADFIYRALKKKYTLAVIEKYITNKQINHYEPEIEYRLTEYRFLTGMDKSEYEDPTRNLIFTKQPIELVKSFGIEQLIGIKKLKITTVQTGYTRQEPLTIDVFMSDADENQVMIERKFTSKWGLDTRYLPAIESFGEGIFISFSNQAIDEWIAKHSSNRNFNNRIDKLFENINSHEYKSVREKFLVDNPKRHLIRFVLIHTLSHLLIKELEFLCGYPSTSINERLFVDENKMQGLLIYTIAGSEGSFGGLVSQSEEKKILKIFKSALTRAMDCASDPICYITDNGQGIGGLNMAACYSCSLLPENSCEEFNSFLDRAILIDKDYGFFNRI